MKKYSTSLLIKEKQIKMSLPPIWLANPKVQYPELLEQKTCDRIAKLPFRETPWIHTPPAASEKIPLPHSPDHTVGYQTL